MDIKKNEFNDLMQFINRSKQDASIEVEALIKKPIDKNQFTSVYEYLKSTEHKLIDASKSITLDVRTKEKPDYRYTIFKQNEILEYCRLNDTKNITEDLLMIKKKVDGKSSIFINEFDIRVNAKSEREILGEDKRTFKLSLHRLVKNFRYKQRFSFLTKNKYFRIDMTIVKQSSVESPNFTSSGTLSANNTYEIEVELLNKNKESKELALELLKILSVLNKILDKTNYLLSNSKKDKVLIEYLDLSKIVHERDNSSLNDIKKKSKSYFTGPEVVTLDMINLLDPKIDIISIKDNYTVTDKADGERALLFIDSTGSIYLLNNRLNVISLGSKSKKFKNTLIDGEHITNTRYNRETNIFAAFDLYYMNKENVKKLPLMSKNKTEQTRISNLKKIVAEISEIFNSENKKMEVTVKDFKIAESDEIFNLSRQIIEKDENDGFKYKLDGLIFTPASLPVGGMFKDEDIDFKKGLWQRLFKWKPPNENTIDFLLEFIGPVIEDVNENGEVKKYKVANLYTSYNKTFTEGTSPIDILTGKIKNDEKIQKRLFAESVYFELFGKKIFSLDNAEVEDDTIIECSYNNDKNVEERFRWSINRTRKDKTQLYRQTKQLQGTANAWLTVQSIWRTINNPITTDIITGKIPVTEDIIPQFDEIYYARESSRERSTMKSLQDFHNFYIKNENLINIFKGKANKLFDIGVGKGGDIHKWAHAGYSEVVGVDVVKDNIMNPNDGAYKRYLDSTTNTDVRRRSFDPEKVKMAFLVMDASKRLDETYINNIEDKEFKKLSKIIYGKGITQDKVDPELKNWFGTVGRGFDVVSTQFAIHFFYENEQTLDNFCANVNDVLKTGGHFIATTLDGDRVHDKLKNVEKGESIFGRKDNRTQWMITKLYDEYDSKDIKKALGKRVEVYVESIGKKFTEYLFSLDILEEKMKKYNIKLLNKASFPSLGVKYSTATFDKYFDDMKEKVNSGKLRKVAAVNAVENMTDVEKEYSFMHRLMIFKKMN